MDNRPAKSWTANLMMVVCILVVCIGVPLSFILGGSSPSWLKSLGIHASPNLSGGAQIAEFGHFDLVLDGSTSEADPSIIHRALALERFSVRKVAFNRWSGMGIAPRLNLVFEFEGELPDPHNSPKKFSMTVIHVYLHAPGKPDGPAQSDKKAKIAFSGLDWNYQVIVDGLHDQARIFDRQGKLVALGLGLYVDQEKASGGAQGSKSGEPATKTRITAALPMDILGDPAKGTWQYYVLVGLSDLRHPSMMLHSADNTGPAPFCGALTEKPTAVLSDRLILRPMVVANSL